MRDEDLIRLPQGLYGYHAVKSVTANKDNPLPGLERFLGNRSSILDEDSGWTAIESTSSIYESDEVVVALTGTPSWRTAELREIARAQGAASAVASTYGECGLDFVRDIQGSFCFALYDAQSGRFVVGTDRLGRSPVYYRVVDDGLIFGSDAVSAFFQLDPGVGGVTNQGIYNYVYFHMVPSPGTVFDGLKKLPPAHYLSMSPVGDVQVTRYWQPRFSEHSERSFQESGEELKSILRDGVARAVDPQKKTAAFLSGGLDSSSVVGMLAEVQDGQSHAYSIGFSAEGYDEMEYARLTANHFGVKLHEYYVTPDDVVAALPMVAKSYGEPFGNSSALPAWFCARQAAKDGVDCLLAGDGGDELFAGNSRYDKQSIFESYLRMPKWFRTGLVENLLPVVPSGFPLSAKGRRFVELANMGLPARLQAFNFLNLHRPEEIFTSEFLEEVATSAPLEMLADTYAVPQEASSLNRMLFLDWHYTLADNDLRKVSHMCSIAGVEVAYPMLDDLLVDFSTRIPSRWKLKRGTLRHFYKESLRGWLPDETIAKKKQGFGLPFGYWMRSHKPLQEIAYDNLIRLKSRGFFNPVFIDKAMSLHRDSHAAYYGELVWIMTVLELWLQGEEMQ